MAFSGLTEHMAPPLAQVSEGWGRALVKCPGLPPGDLDLYPQETLQQVHRYVVLEYLAQALRPRERLSGVWTVEKRLPEDGPRGAGHQQHLQGLVGASPDCPGALAFLGVL